MLLADTSAWIEFLRGTGSPPARRLREAIAVEQVVVVDPVMMEVMGGARQEVVLRTQQLLEAQILETVEPRRDWLDAATIYRDLRRRGVTIRSQIESLIAAVAIRLELPVLHADRDYDAIAAHGPLEVVVP